MRVRCHGCEALSEAVYLELETGLRSVGRNSRICTECTNDWQKRRNRDLDAAIHSLSTTNNGTGGKEYPNTYKNVDETVEKETS